MRFLIRSSLYFCIKNPLRMISERIVFLIFRFHCRKTFAAINRSVVSWFKWNSIYFSAFRTYDFKDFRLFVSCRIFFRLAAFFASERFIFKTFFGIKFLFSCGENEFFSATSTSQSLVLVHKNSSLFTIFVQRITVLSV